MQEFQVSKWSHKVNIPFSIIWSDDDTIAMAAEKGVCVTNGVRRKVGFTAYLLCFILLTTVEASDITSTVFGREIDVIPAAFGDFNLDEYPDLFVIKNNRKSIEILLGTDTEPLLRFDSNLSCNFNHYVTSIVPGDFNGDGLLDVLVTVEGNGGNTSVRILWGYLDHLECEKEKTKEYLSLKGQPLAMDYNQDMILDLFGTSVNGKRTFWVFGKNKTIPTEIDMITNQNRDYGELSIPHSHSFLDFNGDSSADLFITTKDHKFEIWLWDKDKNNFNFTASFRPPKDAKKYGQSLFIDLELLGKIDLLLPVCFDVQCTNSSLYVHSSGKWKNLNVNFNHGGKIWGFIPPKKPGSGNLLLEQITLHVGDFNMDGYPDILATLQTGPHHRSFLLENIECVTDCDGVTRTFDVKWEALSPYNNNTILGVFYDFCQDGVLDIVFVHDKPSTKMNVSAFKNSLDYDANFIKVMVLTGITNIDHPVVPTPLGRKRRTSGTSMPGPIISYNTTTQEGNMRASISPQLPQSAYFSLHLPYSLFGLGRTPNFVDNLNAGVAGHSRSWPQIIPNSQMIVIPWPSTKPSSWTAQLFVTPSKLILQSVLALSGTCAIILFIIVGLYWKERREDHLERQQESHRFHFDAM